MRFFILLAVFAASAWAQGQTQNSTTVYTYDVQGRRVPVSETGSTASTGGSSSSQKVQTINGRAVPLEQAEEKVISEGPNGRVVERTVRRFDPNGNPGEIERVRVEEQNRPDGGMTVTTSVYRSDLNGRMNLDEKSVLRSTVSGNVTKAETVVERQSVNGALQAAERRSTVVRGDEKSNQAESTVYRPDVNGSFAATEREVTKTVQQGATTRVEAAQYNTAAAGQMQLSTQTVSETRESGNGSSTTVVNIYGVTSQGRTVNGANGGPQLREQQIVERVPSNGGFVETFSVRHAAPDDGRLGPTQKISETVCTGECLAEPEPSEKPANPQSAAAAEPAKP